MGTESVWFNQNIFSLHPPWYLTSKIENNRFKKETTVNKAHVRAQTIDKALLILQMLKNAYENSNTYPIFVDTYKVEFIIFI